MRKENEIQNPKSCLNKALMNERLFVLLARYPAAPVAIDAWIRERVRLGLNTAFDVQILEAHEAIAPHVAG